MTRKPPDMSPLLVSDLVCGVSWRPIVGAGYRAGIYEVSEDGRVRGPRGPMAIQMSNSGYPFVRISYAGRQKSRFIHQLVADAFIGPRPAAHDVDHIDHDRLNCRRENLRYLSTKENRADGARISTGNAKLTQADVDAIRALPRPGKRGKTGERSPNSLQAIAARYGMSIGAIQNIISGASWPLTDTRSIETKLADASAMPFKDQERAA
jgi:hypothetical protein